jgi:hypothetical protein
MCANVEDKAIGAIVWRRRWCGPSWRYNLAPEVRQTNTVISRQKSTEIDRNTNLYILVNNFDVSELAVS